MTNSLRSTITAILVAALVLIAGVGLAIASAMLPTHSPMNPLTGAPIDVIPVAQPATPMPVTDADLARTFGDHHRPAPGCTEDEAMVRYSDSVTVCLHIEGDGWRVIEG